MERWAGVLRGRITLTKMCFSPVSICGMIHGGGGQNINISSGHINPHISHSHHHPQSQFILQATWDPTLTSTILTHMSSSQSQAQSHPHPQPRSTSPTYTPSQRHTSPHLTSHHISPFLPSPAMPPHLSPNSSAAVEHSSEQGWLIGGSRLVCVCAGMRGLDVVGLT